jgi:hypothetical protein
MVRVAGLSRNARLHPLGDVIGAAAGDFDHVIKFRFKRR